MDHLERRMAQATVNSLIDALVPRVKVVDNKIKAEDCFVRHALETTVRKMSAAVIRILVKECGKKTLGGSIVLGDRDLLAIADVLEEGQ